jgi:hypothetical protein
MAFSSDANLLVLMSDRTMAIWAVARHLLGLVDNRSEAFGATHEAARAAYSQITPDLLL